MVANHVILMTGTSLGLKTTTAMLLSLYLRANLIESACLGPFPDTTGKSPAEAAKLFAPVRHRRKKSMLGVLAAYLACSQPVILDSAFSSAESRTNVYRLVERAHRAKGKHPELLVVWCHCEDVATRRHRFAHRTADPLATERSIKNLDVLEHIRDEYQRPITETSSDTWPSSGKPIPILDFDTASRSIRVYPATTYSKTWIMETFEFLMQQVAVGRL